MSNEKAAPFFSARRWPKATAGLIAAIVAIPASGLGINLLSPFLNMAEFQVVTAITGAVTGVVGSAAAFLLLAHQFGARVPTRLLPVAFASLGMLVALMSGQAATLVVFGEAGPWGTIVDGISGPFTDGVTALENSVEWWPIPFAVAFTAALMASGWAWDQARPLYVSDNETR